MAKDKSKKKDSPIEATFDAFVDPAEGGDNWKIADALGELLLITPTGLEEDIETVHGSADAIKADVVVINEKKPSKSEEHSGVLIFQAFLKSSLKPSIGKGRVVARLGKGEAQKGKSAPYILEAADAEDKSLAMDYLKSL